MQPNASIDEKYKDNWLNDNNLFTLSICKEKFKVSNVPRLVIH